MVWQKINPSLLLFLSGLLLGFLAAYSVQYAVKKFVQADNIRDERCKRFRELVQINIDIKGIDDALSGIQKDYPEVGIFYDAKIKIVRISLPDSSLLSGTNPIKYFGGQCRTNHRPSPDYDYSHLPMYRE